MPVPRKRKSNSRRGQQRSHDALQSPASSRCKNCDAAKLPHRVCPACGFYAERSVVEVAAE
ncbi:50S ribosomal protein L32 [Myxococcota bacterium]|nr:50S ribosomal protein L32 [Myxococcota bacterium]